MEYFWKKRNIIYFFSSLLVIFVHDVALNYYEVDSSFINNVFRYGISSVAVPMFFLLSGVCFFYNYTPKKLGAKLKSRVFTLLIPYLLWNIIGILVGIIYSYTPIKETISSREIFEPTIENIVQGVFFYKYNYIFWFVYNLIIFTLITPLIDFFMKNKITAAIFVIFCFLLPVFATDALDFVKIDANYVGLYAFGCMVGKHYLKDFTQKLSASKAMAMLGVLIASLTAIILNNYGIIYIPNTLINIIRLMMVLGMWGATDLFASKIRERKIFSESFLIYAVHPYIISIMIKIFYQVLPKTGVASYINFVLSYVSIIILTVVAIKVVKKIFPRIYAILSGNRSKKTTQLSSK